MAANCRIEGLSDGALVDQLRALVGERNRIEAELLLRLAEVDRRRLYLGEAVDSMFRYCVERLGLSEAAAAKRIQVARLSRRFPVIISLLREGQVHLTALNLLAPHLREGNHEELLASASGKSKREVERLLVARSPKPEVATTVRRRPVKRAPAGAPLLECATLASVKPVVAPARRPEPLSEDTYRVTFTADDELVGLLEEVRALTSHRAAGDRTAALIKEALRGMRDRLRKKRFAVGVKPRKSSRKKGKPSATRHIPASVRREVWERDGGSCTYRDASGRRCGSTRHVQFDHVRDWGKGGGHSAENLRLFCRAHNLAKARQVWGDGHAPAHVASG